VAELARCSDVELLQIYTALGRRSLDLALLQGALTQFKTTGFIQIYGLTETTGALTVLSAEDHRQPGGAHMMSCGRAIAGA